MSTTRAIAASCASSTSFHREIDGLKASRLADAAAKLGEHPWNMILLTAIVLLALQVLEEATGPRTPVQSPFT